MIKKTIAARACAAFFAFSLAGGAWAAVIEADVVVIGGGAAGSAAAVAAQERGAKTVLLEKTAFPMGAGTFAGGMFAADSSQQKAEGKVVDKRWLFNHYMSLSGGFVNERLVRRIIDESGKTVDWLNANGADLKLVSAGTGCAFEHVGMPATLHGYQQGGAKAIRALHNSLKAKGGEVLYSTAAESFIFDKDGKIAGVKAKGKKSEPVEVKARAVVVASGGFGGNAEMMKTYIGEPYTLSEVMQNTGDGIRMAWSAGAGRRGENVAQYFFQKFSRASMSEMNALVGPEKSLPLVYMSMRPFLRVNKNGERFSDETKVTLFSVHGAELHMQPDETEYMIFDEVSLKRIARGGLAAIEAHFDAFRDKPEFFMEFNEPNNTKALSDYERKPVDLRPTLSKLAAKEGAETVAKADTLEELARKIGVDADVFKANVEQYNRAAATGSDPLFFSDGKRLQPVAEGPFYAVKLVARNLGTLGGVAVDERLRALTPRGKTVPGLWVAGADAGGMYGKAYVDFEGGTLGFAYISGKLAGEDAAGYVLKH